MERDYKLCKNAYQETIWFIRQYPEYKKMYIDSIGLHSVNIEKISVSGHSDPVFATVKKAERFKRKMDAIEQGLSCIPECYRKGLMDNIIHRKPYPDYADTSTWKRWKRRLIWYVYVEKEYRSL